MNNLQKIEKIIQTSTKNGLQLSLTDSLCENNFLVASFCMLAYAENLLSKEHIQNLITSCIKNRKNGLLLIYCNLSPGKISLVHATPQDTIEAIREGLFLFHNKHQIRFSEAITSFYDIGSPKERKFVQPETLTVLPPIPKWSKEELAIIKAYNSKKSKNFADDSALETLD